ncbi:MAG TPA: preprotein translocase subunit SecE [Candidatus Saccharimonadales bacterium]|nr:preprotein translocase subunit SecE [Candidatus Saccharimonadales bacterium]
MAKSASSKKGPRVRKSAPTVRERVEEASARQSEPRKSRAKTAAAKAASPVRKLRLTDRAAIKKIAPPFRFLKKILKWLVPRYFVNSWREIRQVQWPNRRETWRLTLAVFIFAAVFGALVAGVDKGLDEVFKKVVLK